MLHTIFRFFQAYRFWIYMFIALIGFVLYFVVEHFRKMERNDPGSVERWRGKFISLYIVSLILLISVMVALFLDGYYDWFLSWFIG